MCDINIKRRLFRGGALVFMQALMVLCRSAWAQDQPITFSAMGDGPYGTNQVPIFQQQLANHNRYSPSAFLVHLGDIFSGGEPCDTSHYTSVADMLKGLAVPVWIVPGDNETIDCTDPASGVAHWLYVFNNFEQNFCSAPDAERQSGRPENFAFTMNGVLFIGINMVGGSSPYQQDAEWVTQQLQGKGSQVRAAVVFSHIWPYKSPVFSTPFRQSAAAFGKPVLFLHGHGHSWVMDYPFPEPNILRVQVDNMAAENPIEVTVTTTVTTNPDSMFTIKRNPWASQVVYNMPPCVDAGLDQVISFSQSATLDASASDDGDPNPPGAITLAWSKASGPGTVTFENANALSTTASFSSVGTYVLSLTANDGELQSSDDVEIIVSAGSPIINSFSPTTGAAETEVTITGNYFAEVTSVTFNGMLATSFIIDNATQIRAIVPTGATTGKIGAINSEGTGLSPTDFIVQHWLTANIFGYGSVALDPPGGIYDAGTVVTVTAAPAIGYQFSNWSGDLTPQGGTNPATITVNADKNVTAIFVPDNPSSQIAHEETQTGGSSSSTTVITSTTLTAVSGQLYLAAISTRPKVNVLSVIGLGLNWTLVMAQCSGRNTTGVQVWKAQGIPNSNDVVKATLASAPDNAAIAVSRYSGVDGVTPIGNVISGNTNGANGLCFNGADTNLYSFDLVTTTDSAMAYGAVTMRSKTHTPGTGYIERVEIKQGSINNTAASVAVEDKIIASASTATINGSFQGGIVDWAFVGLEMKPQLKLTTNTVGSGSVTLAPPGGHYNVGTMVTLIPQSGTGFEFTGWSGDLSGSTSPAALTMNGNKTVTAIFTPLPPPQYTLTVDQAGSGNVALNPAGGTYDENTVVTLTATPALGYQFSAWSGDLTGSTNPATITMSGNKTVTATFTLVPVSIVHEGNKTGTASSSLTVTTSASLTGVDNHLYLAAISTRPRVPVSSVTGLGLTWTLVKSKCAGGNTTGIEVWMAQGTSATNGAVTANFASAPSTAVIAVSRYSGVATSNPIGSVIAGNMNGLNAAGACSGGVNSNTYAFDLTTTANQAAVFSAIAIKGQTHIPGAGYTERVEVRQPNGAYTSGVAVEDQLIPAAGTATVNGSFSNVVDWAMVALEIKPLIVTPFTLAVNAVGSGSVTLDPAGGNYYPGTEVTLTPQSEAGFQFSDWSGDLSGSMNPATIIMNANKTVTATFISNDAVAHEQTVTGSASNSAIVKTSALVSGVTEHLYLAAISTRPRVLVSSVSGLGLAWTLVKSKCAGRNTTGIEVWKALGEPSTDDTVKAILASAATNAVIAVSRYSGVDGSNPIGNMLAGNTNGVNANGACSGGVENNAYAFDLVTTVNGSMVYGAAAMKGRTHASGAGYTERAEIMQIGANLNTAVAVEDKRIASISTATLNGSFNDVVDWAVVGVEIKPHSTVSKRTVFAENANSAAAPSAYQLYQNYPNPFNAQTRIQYALPEAAQVSLVIYNIHGRKVRTLVDARQPAGWQHVLWTGTDDLNQTVGSGVYLIRLEAGSHKMTQRILLVK
jgi:uncharacterized repeat protein (TIGR02543 family)